jgi:hypothetical protein
MQKNEVFTFINTNKVKVTAVVVAIISSSKYQTTAICYAQNRLFTFNEHVFYNVESGEAESNCSYSYGEVLVDYAVLPDYNKRLKTEQGPLYYLMSI